MEKVCFNIFSDPLYIPGTANSANEEGGIVRSMAIVHPSRYKMIPKKASKNHK